MFGRHASSEAAASTPSQFSDQFVARLAPLRCLLIEDNEFDCMRMKREMRNLSKPIELTVATNVHSACGTMSDDRFDLLLIDYYLPDGDGFDIANWLLNSGSPNADTPRILLTGEDDPKVRHMAHELGYRSYLSKNHVTLERLEMAMTSIFQTPD